MMSAPNPDWGCCTEESDENDNFLLCNICKKAFHRACLATDSKCDPTSWTCPMCVAKAPKTKNKDDTPVRFNPNVTARTKKRPALQSPPGTSAGPVTEDGVRTIVQEVLQQQFENFTASFSAMFNTQLTSIRDELKDVRNSMDYMSNQFEDVLKENRETREKMKELQEINTKLSLTVKDLSVRMNNMEQHARSSNIEIQCVPQKNNETLITLIQQLGKVINCDVKEENISSCSRVMKINNGSNRPKAIVVQFNTPRLRDTFLAASINFNRSKPMIDKLNTSHLGFGGEKTLVFITEHLSPANRALHAATRLKAKEKGYKYVWVRGGRIYARKSDDSEYIFVRDMDSLNKIG